jgi:hypothetical protein
MINGDTLSIETLDWFPLADGRWLRLSRENHGGPDRLHLRVCEPCEHDVSLGRLWISPAGPMRPTAIGMSLDRATWRRVVAPLRAACAMPFLDAAGVPLVVRRVQRLRAQGQTIRAISETVKLSRSQVHRLLTGKRIPAESGRSR